MKRAMARKYAKKRGCTGRELAAALAGVHLSPAEALAWQKDIQAGRKSLKPPVDNWRERFPSA
jgi:hypothetical protein